MISNPIRILTFIKAFISRGESSAVRKSGRVKTTRQSTCIQHNSASLRLEISDKNVHPWRAWPSVFRDFQTRQEQFPNSVETQHRRDAMKLYRQLRLESNFGTAPVWDLIQVVIMLQSIHKWSSNKVHLHCPWKSQSVILSTVQLCMH